MGIFNKIATLFSSKKDNFEDDSEPVYVFTGVASIFCTPTQYAIYSLSNYYFEYDDAEYLNNIVNKEKLDEDSKISFNVAGTDKGYRKVSLDYAINDGIKKFDRNIHIGLLNDLKNKYYELKSKSETIDKDLFHYDNLLKEAVELKKDKKIEDAINKTKVALLFFDEKLKDVEFEDNISGIIQLAKYLKDNKNYDEAWKIIDNKRMEVEETSFRYKRNYESLRMMYSSLVRLNKEALMILKKEKKFTDYYYYLSEFMYLELVKNAFDGNSKKLNILFDKYELLSNIDLKMINDEVLKNEWHQAILKFLNAKKELLFKISKEIEKWDDINKQKIKDWDNSTNMIEMGNYYNKMLSDKMSILK